LKCHNNHLPSLHIQWNSSEYNDEDFYHKNIHYCRSCWKGTHKYSTTDTHSMVIHFLILWDVLIYIRISSAYYHHYFALFYVNCLPDIQNFFFPFFTYPFVCLMLWNIWKFLYMHKVTYSHTYVILKKGYDKSSSLKILIFNLPSIFFCHLWAS